MDLPQTLRTQRLALRAPRLDDAQTVFQRWTQDFEVAKYLWRPHREIAETTSYLTDCVAAWQEGTRRPYVLTLPRDDSAIGVLDVRRRGHLFDLGFVLARSYWGQGFMPEAVAEITRKGLALADIFRVQATCDVENIGSVRTLEKAGFSKEGRMERHTANPNFGSPPRAVFMYAQTR